MANRRFMLNNREITEELRIFLPFYYPSNLYLFLHLVANFLKVCIDVLLFF